jgi:Tol biopolymer transport system component
MKKSTSIFTTVLTVLISTFVFSTTVMSADATGPYFGQQPPGRTPELFAPGILSLPGRLESNLAFSPDGNECFFVVWGVKFSSAKIFWTKRVDNVWTPQVEAPFSVGHYVTGPSFSADGTKLYFGGRECHAIWMSQRTTEGWSDPQRLASPINSGSRDFAYSETSDGVGYFASDRPGGQGTSNLNDLWRMRQTPGRPLEVENLGAVVNSTDADFDPYIARDGSYLIFTSERPGGIGRSDLYESFADGKGGWTAPANLNDYSPGINLAGYATVGPSISPDGKYLFFTRYAQTPTGEQEDIYWVDNPFSDPAKGRDSTRKVSGPNGAR